MSKKKNKAAARKRKLDTKLASMFKLSREQLAQRKTTGAGLHKTHKDTPRSEKKRQAINDQL